MNVIFGIVPIAARKILYPLKRSQYDLNYEIFELPCFVEIILEVEVSKRTI